MYRYYGFLGVGNIGTPFHSNSPSPPPSRCEVFEFSSLFPVWLTLSIKTELSALLLDTIVHFVEQYTCSRRWYITRCYYRHFIGIKFIPFFIWSTVTCIVSSVYSTIMIRHTTKLINFLDIFSCCTGCQVQAFERKVNMILFLSHCHIIFISVQMKNQNWWKVTDFIFFWVLLGFILQLGHLYSRLFSL